MTVAELHEALQYDESAYCEQQGERFTALLKADLEALSKIQYQEKRWTTALRNKEVPFDFDLDREITECYRKWMRNAAVRLEQIRMQREIGCDPATARDFERRVEEVDEALQMRIRSEGAALARYRMLHEEE
jgi:hypothetical protein